MRLSGTSVDRPKRTKQQTVFEDLRLQILTGALQPGTRLTIRDLSDRMGVSDIPVREALKVLEVEGLVRITPYTGIEVSPVSPDDLREIAEVRSALEPYATGLAAARITPEALERLAACLSEMEEAGTQDDGARYEELNTVFHSSIYEAAGNQRLWDMILGLWDHARRNRAVFSQVTGHLNRSLEEHRMIYQALKIRDPELAQYVSTVHRRNASSGVQRLLGKDENAL
jgi:DNA-binding GntR family transcriptional regulator